MINSHSPKALDLFAGAGGLTLGLHQSSWNVVAAIENNSWAVSTYKQNVPPIQALYDSNNLD
ncbi:DNA cytosine methyltransferase [Coleofasciculus sp. E1-EBD-02]|jgi:DNA (cytosine-5)-methyltransferase 1|uniref:DNA cytosine methyltransferase n=1 Tax=Coleofasciculus sp. E1-EBD-02 TaxID=3068481 RepID=UPI0032F6BDF8